MKSLLLVLLAALPMVAQPFNQVTMKGSHNSQDRDESLPESLACDLAEPWQGCCLSVELDLAQDPDGDWQWALDHDRYDASDPTLVDALTTLENWHAGNSGHLPVTVVLDLKTVSGSDATFATQIDQVFRDTLGAENIYSPSQLRGSSQGTLLAAAQANGWPSMSALKGKFILVFSGSDSGSIGDRKKTYAAQSGALAFVDSAGTMTTDGSRVFLNLGASSSNYNWCKQAYDAQALGGWVTRLWVVNDQSLWTSAVLHGVNLIATDKVSGTMWATLNGPFKSVPEPAVGCE